MEYSAAEKGEIIRLVENSSLSVRRTLVRLDIHKFTFYGINKLTTRVRERGMRKLKSMRQAQRFLNAHAAVYNLFNLG